MSLYNVYEQRIKDGKIRQIYTCLGSNKEKAEKQFSQMKENWNNCPVPRYTKLILVKE